MQALQGEPTPEPQLIRADPPPIPDESLRPLNKSGGSARRFYRTLLRKADERFDRHLARLAKEGES